MRHSISFYAMLSALTLGISYEAAANPESASMNLAVSDANFNSETDNALKNDVWNDVSLPQKCGLMECLPLVDLIDDVYYTVNLRIPVSTQAAKWGVPANVLTTLNDGLTPETILEPGQKLLVDARMASAPVPYSRGKCNRGRLSNGRMMPEGDGYFLRTDRARSFGTDVTIQALMTLFKAYHEKYPDAPRVNIGDISKRRGGKANPHKSHQSGRDVDFGFVHTTPPDEHHPEHFVRGTAQNLDIEKTWFLVETLVRTGTVKVIYVDRTVMKLLWNYASPKLTKEQQEFFFSNPRHEKSASAILQHWPGHKNHFHVRFKCPTEQLGCRN